MSPRRILQLCWSSRIGGVERNLIEYADAFQKKGNYVVTCTFGGEGPLPEAFRKRNLPIIPLGITNPLKIGRFTTLIKLFITQKFDVLHVYGLKALVLTTFIAKFFGVPVIIVGLRSTDDWRKIYHVLIEKPTYPFVDGWIAVSNEVKEAFMKREKIPAGKIKVIHNAINTQLFCPISIEQRKDLRKQKKIEVETFVIGYVANFKPLKGHKDLIDALALLKKQISHIKVYFVGIDLMNGEIQKYIEEHHLTNEVELTGYIADIKEILSIFDLFVIPSLIEGLPMSMLEAMAVGIPVIATPVGGIPEVIVNNENGILVPVKDPNVLSRRILELIQEKNLRVKLSENALRTIQERYSLDSKIVEMLDYYSSFLRRT